MRIAIDITPIGKSSNSAHKVRGVGSYIRLLKTSLEEFDRQNEYLFFEDSLPKNADIIHIPYFDAFFFTLPFPPAKNIIITVHDLTPIVFKEHFPAGLKGNIVWSLQKQLLKKFWIVTDSHASAQDIEKIVHVQKPHISPVHLAVSEKFRPVSNTSMEKKRIMEKYNVPEKFALYVGDATWNKNLPRLVQAIKQTDIPLVLVGKALKEPVEDRSNPWNKSLIDVQNQTQNNSQFIFTGYVPEEDLIQLYNLATLFVMPSLYEGFGLPVLEAMACGTPVITSRSGSLSEVAGEAVVYVDPVSTESISKGIQEVWNSTKFQKELSEKSLIQAKKFTSKKFAEEMQRFYNMVGNSFM